MCIICEIKNAFIEDPNEAEVVNVDASYILERIELLGRVGVALSDALGGVLAGRINGHQLKRLREIQMVAASLFADGEEAQAFRAEALAQMCAVVIDGRAPEAGTVWADLFAGMMPARSEPQRPEGFPAEVWEKLPQVYRDAILKTASEGGSVGVFIVPTNDKEPTKH